VSAGITELEQLYKNGPEFSPVGDCYRTALACLFGFKDPEAVPHFVDEACNAFGKGGIAPEPMWVREWAQSIGWDMAGLDLESCKDWCKVTGVPLFGLATVPGHQAKWHSVVWDVLESRVRWDPSTCESRDLDEDMISGGYLEIVVAKYDPGPETMTREPNCWPPAEILPIPAPWAIGT
jgi:hypothetical protein